MDINPNARLAAWPRDVSPEEVMHRLYQSAVQRALPAQAIAWSMRVAT